MHVDTEQYVQTGTNTIYNLLVLLRTGNHVLRTTLSFHDISHQQCQDHIPSQIATKCP